MEPVHQTKSHFGFSKLSNWFLALSKKKKVALLLIALFLVSGTGVSAWYYNRLSNLNQLFPEVAWPGGEASENDSLNIDEAFKDSKIINIALMGFDRSQERGEEWNNDFAGRPDTIMVAAINIESGDINVISIPRDTLVPIYDRGGAKEKINSAFHFGWSTAYTGLTDPQAKHQSGLNSQLETISTALGGVKIHYYLSLDMDAVVEIVEIMGGVWYDVQRPTYHNTGRIIAEPGYQWFSGRRFLEYVRSRQFDEGDSQRAKNQQSILLAAFDQFKKANKLVNAPQVLLSIRNNVETNLSLEQIMALALFGTRGVDTEDINTHVLAGALTNGRLPGHNDTNNYFLLNQQKRVELIRQIWGINLSPDPTDYLLPPLPPAEEETEETEEEPGQQEPEDEDDEDNNDEDEDQDNAEEDDTGFVLPTSLRA